jgi:heavy metal sensor kinase
VTRSLRRTLAVRFAATMGIGLVAAAAAAYCATRLVLRHEFDRGLVSAAFLAYEHFETDSDHAGMDSMLTADRGRYASDVNRYLVLRDPGGAATRSLPAFAADLPLDSAAFAAARRGSPAWADGSWNGQAIRSLYTRFPRHGAGDRVLQVSASLAPIAAVQRRMLLALLAVVLLGTAATLVGAGWLAGSAVRPVHAITEQATRIEAGTLSQRIAAHADTDEYRGLVAVLNRMLERLDIAFKNQRRLTADVSHELRSPLTALRGEIEVALRAERSLRDYQRVLHSALEEIDRLSQMSEDLLLITRADAKLLQPQRTPTDVNGLVEDALDHLRVRVEERELTVERRLAPDAAGASVDPDLVARVVHHLLDNAVKFTPPGGTIRVTTAPLDGEQGVRLTVEDSGPGIAVADLPHIFEPFYRADQARSRGTGTGLGLAMAAAIARLHGGAIHVSSASGGGTGARFEVDLPSATTPEPASVT